MSKLTEIPSVRNSLGEEVTVVSNLGDRGVEGELRNEAGPKTLGGRCSGRPPTFMRLEKTSGQQPTS